MMQKVFISADALITPFGVGSDLAFQKIKSGQTAIQKHFHPDFSDCECCRTQLTPVPVAATVPNCHIYKLAHQVRDKSKPNALHIMCFYSL